MDSREARRAELRVLGARRADQRTKSILIAGPLRAGAPDERRWTGRGLRRMAHNVAPRRPVLWWRITRWEWVRRGCRRRVWSCPFGVGAVVGRYRGEREYRRGARGCRPPVP